MSRMNRHADLPRLGRSAVPSPEESPGRGRNGSGVVAVVVNASSDSAVKGARADGASFCVISPLRSWQAYVAGRGVLSLRRAA
jgi:hypothetical protein